MPVMASIRVITATPVGASMTCSGGVRPGSVSNALLIRPRLTLPVSTLVPDGMPFGYCRRRFCMTGLSMKR